MKEKQYRKLRNALTIVFKLVGIDEVVYSSACNVIDKLENENCSCPKIFTHGNDSVVFNWTLGNKNVYLAISKQKASWLISTHELITDRAEFPITDFDGTLKLFMKMSGRL